MPFVVSNLLKIAMVKCGHCIVGKSGSFHIASDLLRKIGFKVSPGTIGMPKVLLFPFYHAILNVLSSLNGNLKRSC